MHFLLNPSCSFNFCMVPIRSILGDKGAIDCICVPNQTSQRQVPTFTLGRAWRDLSFDWVMSKSNKSINRPPTPEPEESRDLTLEESVQLKVRYKLDLLLLQTP